MNCLSQTRYQQISRRSSRTVRVVHRGMSERERWWGRGNRIRSGRWSSGGCASAHRNAHRVSGHRMTSEALLGCPKYCRAPLGQYGVNELTNGLEVLRCISFWVDCFGVGCVRTFVAERRAPRTTKDRGIRAPALQGGKHPHVPFYAGKSDLSRGIGNWRPDHEVEQKKTRQN